MKFQLFSLIPGWGWLKEQEYVGQNQKGLCRSLSAMFALGAFLGLAIAAPNKKAAIASAASFSTSDRFPARCS
ncbi:hypothetical protein [Nostoc sp.]|uniref:hypothetical protein n=1 Tax=Nostoc sp. TaxID=1180 RepID=UPI002FF67C99